MTLTITNNFGADSLTVINSIIVYPPVQFAPISQHGDTLFSVPGYSSYQWFSDTSLITGANDYYYVIQHDGDYSVQVTDSNGCSAVATMIDVISDVIELNSKSNFYVTYNDHNIIVHINSAKNIISNILLPAVQDMLIKTTKY